MLSEASNRTMPRHASVVLQLTGLYADVAGLHMGQGVWSAVR
jgi:hypothetical protein